LVYLRAEGPRWSKTIRETIDTTFTSHHVGLALTPRGEPLVLYRQPQLDGTIRLMLACRTPGGWTREKVLDRAPALGG